MQAGTVIGKAWDMYKAHWRHLLPIAFVVYVLISLLILLLGSLGWLGTVVGFFVSIAGVFWLQGALVLAVDDVRDGRADLSLSETLERVRPHLTTLALAGLLAGIAITFGFILLIVPGLFLLTIWRVIVLTVLIFIGVGIVFAILEGVLDSRWLSFALNIVLQTITAPFLALAWTITYYELRDLKGAEPTAA